MMEYYLRLLNWPQLGEEQVEPAGEVEGHKIFEIPDSQSVNTGISVYINGRIAGHYKNFAVDSNNIAYIFDVSNQKILGSLGPCEIFTA